MWHERLGALYAHPTAEEFLSSSRPLGHYWLWRSRKTVGAVAMDTATTTAPADAVAPVDVPPAMAPADAAPSTTHANATTATVSPARATCPNGHVLLSHYYLPSRQI